MKSISSYLIFKALFLVFVFTGFQSCSKDAEMDLMSDSAELSQTELKTILEADSYTCLLYTSDAADDLLQV